MLPQVVFEKVLIRRLKILWPLPIHVLLGCIAEQFKFDEFVVGVLHNFTLAVLVCNC